MICSICHAENPAGAEKCQKCGAPLKAASADAPIEDEFALQPETPRQPEGQTMQGPPRVDADEEMARDDGDNEAQAPGADEQDGTAKTGKKKKKKAPDRPKDYKRQAQILMAAMATLLLLPLVFCLVAPPDYCGHGLPNLIGLIFGGLAMLESIKVQEYYNAGDFEGAEKASTTARWYIRVGIIAAIVALAILVSIQILWLIFGKISNVVSPKTDVGP